MAIDGDSRIFDAELLLREDVIQQRVAISGRGKVADDRQRVVVENYWDIQASSGPYEERRVKTPGVVDCVWIEGRIENLKWQIGRIEIRRPWRYVEGSGEFGRLFELIE